MCHGIWRSQLLYIANDFELMSSSVLQLLADSLNPSSLEATQRDILRARTSQGFATDLMIIADNSSLDLSLRQAALAVLKNMVFDECAQGGVMNSSDWLVLKSSALDFLSRIWGEKRLTGLLREIIHLLAEKDYPERWPEILPSVMDNIKNPTDFNTVASSVEILKALASVCGRSPDREVTLNSFCNVIFTPLFGLANQLFSNYSEDNQPILVSIFKTINLAVFYHLPTVLTNNIHALMIFCRKLLELPGTSMQPLKVVSLQILTRIYSRHVSAHASYKLIKFAEDFHSKYSCPMVEIFVQQLLDPDSSPEILSLSLKCLTCIHKAFPPAAELIDSHRRRLVELCVQRFRVNGNFKSGQSVGAYITCLREERSQMVQFFSTLFSSSEAVLGDVTDVLTQSDEKAQQVALYAFGALAEDIQSCPQLHGNMAQFIVSYVLPILSGPSSSFLKARGCQVLSAYTYVELPQQQLQAVFQFLYSCLIQTKEPYINIYALDAFTHLLLKHENFLQLVLPYLANVLRVYTQLMKQSHGEVSTIIKSFESLLGSLSGADIQPYAVDLIKFLIDLFIEYSQSSGAPHSGSSSEDEDGEEDESPYNASQGCIACIRQILAADKLPQELYSSIDQAIIPLLCNLLQDKQLLHFEEALNILNMLVYRRQGPLPQVYHQFFLISVYAVLGIPPSLANLPISEQYKSILVNVCVDPDEDIVSNVVGLLRNFVARLQGELSQLKDETGTSFLEYLFKVVSFVSESRNNEGGYVFKESDRWIAFTLYISLLEYNALQENQLKLLLDNTIQCYRCKIEQKASNRPSMLLEILFVAIYYYPQWTAAHINVSWFLREVLCRWDSFTDEYQLHRLIIGLAKTMEAHIMAEQSVACELMRRLPDLVFRYAKERQKEDSQDAIDAEDEAEEELMAENTHLGMAPKDKEEIQRERELLNADDRQWEEEYNKYYESPMAATSALGYLGNVLGSSQYRNLLSVGDQERLCSYIKNGGD